MNLKCVCKPSEDQCIDTLDGFQKVDNDSVYKVN